MRQLVAFAWKGQLSFRIFNGFGPICCNLRMLYTGFALLEERERSLVVVFVPRVSSVLRWVGGDSGRF